MLYFKKKAIECFFSHFSWRYTLIFLYLSKCFPNTESAVHSGLLCPKAYLVLGSLGWNSTGGTGHLAESPGLHVLWKVNRSQSFFPPFVREKLPPALHIRDTFPHLYHYRSEEKAVQDLEWEDPGSSALPTLDGARIQAALLSSPAPSACIRNFRKLTHMSNVQGTWKGAGLPEGSLGLVLPSLATPHAHQRRTCGPENRAHGWRQAEQPCRTSHTLPASASSSSYTPLR